MAILAGLLKVFDATHFVHRDAAACPRGVAKPAIVGETEGPQWHGKSGHTYRMRAFEAQRIRLNPASLIPPRY
jgi:hypothetical protein